MAKPDKPNILVVWGDSIGVHDISAYTQGLSGYRTPNIDLLAEQGAVFTDAYGEQSSIAGRSAFILGQHPFRTGLLASGRPRSSYGIAEWMPTLADLLKPFGYISGHFGKSSLGDGDEHLPTAHGFDEFFGNLYDLDTEAEPESYYYPTDIMFRRKYAPRGVLHSWCDADYTQVEDTGLLSRQRMATIDEEVLIFARRFIERAVAQARPFFVWVNSVNARSWARPDDTGPQRETGISPYADGMVRHDRIVGALLDQITDLGLSENTIVIYSTDQGAGARAHNAGVTPFRYGNGTSEGRRRVPLLVRWPGLIKPGTQINEIIAHADWMPTLMTAAGVPNIAESLRIGHSANGREFKVCLDGYDFTRFFDGRDEHGPRSEYLYFSETAELEAIRFLSWKIQLAANGVLGSRIANLRADPYENANGRDEGQGDRAWIPALARERIEAFFKDFDRFPHQRVAPVSAYSGYATV